MTVERFFSKSPKDHFELIYLLCQNVAMLLRGECVTANLVNPYPTISIDVIYATGAMHVVCLYDA